MQDTRVRSLDRGDPLEKGVETRSNVLPGESHGQRSLVGYRPRGHEESDTTERLSLHARQDRRSWKVGVLGLLVVG